MLEQRPIVYYDRLMQQYDREVMQLLAQKTEYLLLEDPENPLIEEVLPTVNGEALENAGLPKLLQTAKDPIIPVVLVPRLVRSVVAPPLEKRVAPEEPVVPEEAPAPVAKTMKVPQKVMTGLGLSLGAILDEEQATADKNDLGYF